MLCCFVCVWLNKCIYLMIYLLKELSWFRNWLMVYINKGGVIIESFFLIKCIENM